MMKRGLLVAWFWFFGISVFAQEDPVLMRVNGKDILRSEFEYSYRHRTGNADAKLSPKEYAELFAQSKLKVEAAKVAGLDTTTMFRKLQEAWLIRRRKLIAFDTCQSGTLECHFAGAVLQVIISLRNALARKSIRCNNIGASLQVASVNIRYHIRTSNVEHVVVAFHHTRQIAEPLTSEVFFCKIILLNLSTHGTIENQNFLLYNLS